MDFKSFCESISRSQSCKWTSRQKLLDAYERVLFGEMYSHIGNPYTRENQGNNGTGKRLSLDDRRASVEMRLPHILVRDVVGETWGEEHRPNVLVHDDPYTSAWIQAFLGDTSFWLTMIEATWESTVGSGCVVLRVLAEPNSKEPGRFAAEVWPSKECEPIFLRHRPGVLKEIPRTYSVSADSLRADGYDVDALEQQWANKNQGSKLSALKKSASDSWVARVRLTQEAEEWYLPVPEWLYETPGFTRDSWELDPDRTTQHGLGETPAVWLRPIPFRHKLFPDGLCVFEPAINWQFRIDRTLSQTGRAFDYAGDPQLAVSQGGSGGGDFGEDDDYAEVGGATASDTIPLDTGGKAEFVEISGEGLKVAIEAYVKILIRLGKEVSGASMIDPESKIGQQLSGTAMKLMRSSLRVLVGILRITLGERGFLDLIRLAMRMSQRVKVDLPTLKARIKAASAPTSGEPDPNAFLELQWPNAYPVEGQDKLFEVQATKLAALNSPEAGPAIISQQTAVANGAPLFDVQDSAQELADVLDEAEAAHKAELELAAAETPPKPTASAAA